MVPDGHQDDDSSSSPTEEGEDHSHPTSHPGTSPPTQKTAVGSVCIIRTALEKSGIPSKTIKIILQGWRQNTKKQYDVYLRKFLSYCNKWGKNPLSPSVVLALEFLTELHESGNGYSVINTARSSISALWSIVGEKNFGSHPLICRFMKGIFELTPSVPRYRDTWDVSIVLKYLKNQKQNEFLTVPELTRKLFTLMALAKAQRLQSIHLIRVDCIFKDNAGIKIEIIDKIKQSKPGMENSVLSFEPNRTDNKLCVVKTLKDYLDRTRDRRKGKNKLFLCYKKPYQEATKDTTSRWMKVVMSEAGIDIEKYKPHSCRHASSSDMIKKGVPLDKVLKTAGWSSASTFYKFYNRKCESTCSQKSILDYVEK